MSCDCEEKKTETITSDPETYKYLTVSIMVIVILGYIFIRAGLTRFIPLASGAEIGASMAFVFGIAAGLSTCMALVGGIVVAISARYAETHPEESEMQRLKPQIAFNGGRIVIFTLLGGLMGYLGSFLRFSPVGLGAMILLASVAMLFIGLQLTGISPKLSNYSITLPKSFQKILHKNEHLGAFALGGLTFILPCGFTQAVQLAAIASGSLYTGALIMGLFALGTTPGLFLAGAVSSSIKGKWATKLFIFVGVLVVLLSLFNMRNAFNLIGLSRVVKPAAKQVQMADGVQTIKMDVTARGYSPNTFTVKKGVPVKWEINVKDTGTCAAFLIAPKITDYKALKRGTNTIEFTPEEAGNMNFSCSMGMYTGKFVVE